MRPGVRVGEGHCKRAASRDPSRADPTCCGRLNPLRLMRSAGEAHCLVRGRERLVLSRRVARVFYSGGHTLEW